MRNRPVIRTCCACRKKAEKSELLRIVRLPNGNVELDPKEKKSGRGVYLCKQTECIRKAKKANIPGRSLNSEIPEQIWSELEKEEYGK